MGTEAGLMDCLAPSKKKVINKKVKQTINKERKNKVNKRRKQKVQKEEKEKIRYFKNSMASPRSCSNIE